MENEKQKTQLLQVKLLNRCYASWEATVRVPAHIDIYSSGSRDVISQVLTDFNDFVDKEEFSVEYDTIESFDGELFDEIDSALPDYEWTEDGVITPRDLMPLNDTCKGKSFLVRLMRPCYEIATVRVLADTPEQAERVALDEVGENGENISWWTPDDESFGKVQLADPDDPPYEDFTEEFQHG